LNDYSYRQDSGKLDDSRWVHRPAFDWERAVKRHDTASIEGRVFQPLVRLIQIRKSHPVFGGGKAQVIDTDSPSVFGFIHWHLLEGLLVLANFSEQPQQVDMIRFRTYGLKPAMIDLVSEEQVNLGRSYTMQPYQFLWLVQK
ncbi:MAG: amylosucrase, partial [Anaerolineae bacterium]|nr:amylosucrase [Anaerolineae bacterium]